MRLRLLAQDIRQRRVLRLTTADKPLLGWLGSDRRGADAAGHLPSKRYGGRVIVRYFIAIHRSSLLGVILATLLMPLSFRWSSDGGMQTIFLGRQPLMVALLWAASATMIWVAIVRARNVGDRCASSPLAEQR